MKDYKLTDPEFAERFEHFAFDEVINEEGQQLDEITPVWKSPALWTRA